jgi:hypothetical protein
MDTAITLNPGIFFLNMTVDRKIAQAHTCFMAGLAKNLVTGPLEKHCRHNEILKPAARQYICIHATRR